MYEEQSNDMSTEINIADSDNSPHHGTDSQQNPSPLLVMDESPKEGFWSGIRGFIKGKRDTTLRETLEDAIEDGDFVNDENEITEHEKMLLSNVLKLKDKIVTNVMVPRADIVAIDVHSSHEDLLTLLAKQQFSRLPVYKGNLDNMLGSIHIKDVMAKLAKGDTINIHALLREIPVVSPAMPVLDLMIYMQKTHKHMAFVVDEFGGIDGLVTIGDVIESVVGEIDDEYDQDNAPQIQIYDSGDVWADARVEIDEFEKTFGTIFSMEERDESETLGGLVLYIAGRVPARGEVFKHASGMIFEVLDANPRKINRLRIKNIPNHDSL